MNKIKHFNYSLLCAAALGALTLGHPAMAQTDAQIQTIQQQIKAAAEPTQSDEVGAGGTRSRREGRAGASQGGAGPGRGGAGPAARRRHRRRPLQVAAPRRLPGRRCHQGAFKVGGLTVTLGGFAAVEGIYRSRNMASSIDTNFNSIPFANSPNYHIREYRETAQQSRFSLMTEGQLDDVQKLTGYLETDFLSAGSSSNSNQSNSYTLRVRQFWGNYDNTDWACTSSAARPGAWRRCIVPAWCRGRRTCR